MVNTVVNWRIHLRLSVAYPVIFGGAPFVGEGTISNISQTGCSVNCDRSVLIGSYIKLSVLLPDPTSSLFIELGGLSKFCANLRLDVKVNRQARMHKDRPNHGFIIIYY